MNKLSPLFDERGVEKAELICGIDEVGRGPLAGPVVASAVILPKDFLHSDIKDSKKLNRSQIITLSKLIKEKALSYGIGVVSAKFIDENDILTATFKAMEIAFSKLKIKPDLVLVDGNHKIPYLKYIPQFAVVKGDSKYIQISSASIIAKDYRDSLMENLDKKYKVYKFEKHKGYGTKLHIELIKKYGASDIHRKTFLRSILEEKNGLF